MESEKNKPQLRYSELGASASKSEVHSALTRAGVDISSQYFATLLPDPDPSYYSFLHCDGAGTKTIIPYLQYRETGTPLCFAGLAQDALVMNLDDMVCCGPVQDLILSNLILRNAAIIPSDVVEAIVTGYTGLVADLRLLGVPIALGGGETADCGDTIRTLSVDAVLMGRLQRARAISFNKIQSGDLIIGVSSTGRSSYEHSENSGIGSNGITLARHSLLHHSYAERFPEILAPETSKEIAYRGPFKLNDTPADLGMSIFDALSSPTRSYAPILFELYRKFPAEIHGVVHVTGGALTKVLRFGVDKHYIKDSLLPTPTIFKLIEKYGAVPRREMFQVFNMGQRLELYLPERITDNVLETFRSFGLHASVIGRVQDNKPGEGNTLTIRDQGEEYRYTV